mmetsp:Transcript_14635/g.24223  ORF Transcript_14635/g.24223 Transcript_14635/m.24223 type:complete len:310 (+) Transcript_14635:254-1183(+)
MEISKAEITAKYAIGKILGTGTFGTVRAALSMTDFSKWAVKILSKKSLEGKDNEIVNTEVQILQIIRNPNIIFSKEVFYTKKHVLVFMERLNGGDLFDRIVKMDRIPEVEARLIFKQIVLAVRYLHSINVVHRDLKPENMMFETASMNSTLKIIDFGLATIMEPGKLMNSPCGSPGYVAPEILMDYPYNEKVYVWSIGVILYVMLCGYPPFEHESKRVLFGMMIRGEYDFDSDEWLGISAEAKDIVRKMLDVDYTTRISASDILFHDWMLPVMVAKGNRPSIPANVRRLTETQKSVSLPKLLPSESESS